MNVVFEINGREAIPVRAIPLVTNWRFMSPDIVAHVLGGTGGSHVSLFGDLHSYQVEAGQSSPMKKDWWAQFPVKELQALSKKIKETEPDDVVGYATWRKLALKELPAGVFVWKDEYQTFHDENWNSRFRQTYCALKGWNGEESDEDVASQMQRDLERDLRRDDLVDDDPLKRELRESLEVLKRWREADFSPFMQVQLQRIVIEGFEAQYAPTPTASLASAAVDVEVAALLDKIDKCRESIQLWETRDISRASDAEIAQHKLEPLRAELALLEQRKRVMRGDFSGEPEPATMPAPVVAAIDGPAKRSRKPSWSTVAMPYMKSVFNDGKYKSSTVFYKVLLSRADTPNSPFTKLKGELYCTEAGTTVAEGTVGTKWKEIRAG